MRSDNASGSPIHEWLAGGGEMGELIRAKDWSATPIGPVESWSPALRTMVRFLLANRFPLLLWWGPDYVSIYNDPYRPVLGKKHPWALGLPVRDCWSEIWHVLQPLIDTPFHGGPATWNEDIELELNRHGFVEETHFTVAYSPVPDESVASGIGGVLATVHEITEKIVAERRVVVLRDLGARVGDAKTAEEACAVAAHTLGAHAKDIPFALLYLVDADRAHARLAGAAGVRQDGDGTPAVIDLRDAAASAWPIRAAIETGAPQRVDALGEAFRSVAAGPWSDAPRTAVVLPIASTRAGEPVGAIVAGLSARLAFDQYYRDFLDLVRTQIATAISHARAYEEERKRAEALAQIDRAKTAFFSNVSHEFRTPLTLLVGPIEDGLADAESPLPPAQRERQEIAHRNALRLLRLVNTLLDFSRIEAGRIDASYEPTDLSALTTELASVFRSAIEKAGLTLVVDCPPSPEPVHVDRDMWEKIVLNLLSNAFKFTFDGQIRVELRWRGDRVALRVADTGVGIPAADLPRMFERFHRVKNARARTHEGTGIGLALVQELARLHGGTVDVESREGQGTTFTVAIRTGTSHLPADRIAAARQLASTGLGTAAFVEEALRWNPSVVDAASPAAAAVGSPASTAAVSDRAARILVADDNADMRDYLARILGQTYAVETVGDGQRALDRVRAHAPDLVLTDVMMPTLDGFGLLAAIRGDDRTRSLPVILLSARAGEEARIEGLQAGADEYLVKPFSARELLACVGSQLRLAELRRESERALRHRSEQHETLLNEAPLGVYLVDADFTIREVNPIALPVFGDVEGGVIGRDFGEIIHLLWEREYADEIVRIFRRTLETGEPYVTAERAEPRRDRGVVEYYEWRLHRITLPDGRFGLVCYFRDISEQKKAAAAKAHLAAIVDSADDAIIAKDLDGTIQSCNAAAERLFGYPAAELVGRPVRMLIPAERQSEEDDILARVRRGERIDRFETVRVTKDGRPIEVSVTVSPVRDESGRIIGASKIARDITHDRQAEAERVRLLQENAAVTEALNNVGAIVASDLDRSNVVQAVTDAGTELTGAEFGAFFYNVVDEKGEAYTLYTISGVPREAFSKFPMPRNTAVFEPTFKGTGIVRSPDITRDPRYGHNAPYHGMPAGHLPVRSYLAVPVRGRSEVLGGLFFGHSQAGRFTEQHERLALGIASWASVALENARLYTSAQEANRIKDDFLASLSHELRTPLNAILGYARMLRAGTLPQDKQKKAVDTIERNATSLTQIVEDVLDVSRIVAGKIRLDVQPIELPEVIRAALDGIGPAADAKGVRIESIIDPQAAPISGDPERLQQILWNLLSNAVKFTARGGKVQVRLQRVNSHVEVTVSDTGVGIAPEFLPYVFERFRQADSGISRERRGLGLGLSIARQLAEMHGGTIDAASGGVGHGATFRVTFPVMIVHPVRDAEPRVPLRASTTGINAGAVDLKAVRVLAVDDEPDALTLVCEVLEAAGARVTTALSAVDGLSTLDVDVPDVLVADLGMPRMDGFAFIDRVRRHADDRVRRVPAVALTAYARSEDRTKALRAGFQMHLAKPIDPAELVTTIAALAKRFVDRRDAGIS